MNIKESIKLIKDAKAGSNEEQLNIYNHLFIIEREESWKQDWYYKNAQHLKKKYAEYSFGNFIREVFAVHPLWYAAKRRVLSLPNGKKLFLEYGQGNMATLVNSTENERQAILAEAKTGDVIPRFSAVKRKLFPPSPKVKVPHFWKEKYDKLKDDFDKYKEQAEGKIKELETAIKTLKQTIKVCFTAEEKEKTINQ